MDTDGMVDGATEAALKALHDIVLPQPVSYVPQTWGWAALAFVIAMLLGFSLWSWLRHRRANRYRREALAELVELATQNITQATADSLDPKLGEILKRTALAAWPREDVASLTGTDWAAFLIKHSSAHTDEQLTALVDEREYQAGALPSPRDRALLIAAVRKWIEGHHVSA